MVYFWYVIWRCKRWIIILFPVWNHRLTELPRITYVWILSFYPFPMSLSFFRWTFAEIRLQVEELEPNVTVAESDSIRLGCSIPSQSSRDSRFSVSWYVERSEGDDDDQPGDDERKRECVFSIGHDAVFGNGNCSPRESWSLRTRRRMMI